jgi:hypothetical protein
VVAGAFAAIVVVALIYAFTLLRPVPRIDTDFGPEKLSFTTGTPPNEAFKVVEALPVSTKYKLGRVDLERARIIFQDSVTMSTYGFFYPVDVTPGAEGSTITVGVRSKYPLQFGPLAKRSRDKALQAMVDALKAKLAGTI